MKVFLCSLMIGLFLSTSALAQEMKLDFKLDDRFLICHIITKNLSPSNKLREILELQKAVKVKFPELYKRLYNTNGNLFNPVGLRTLSWIDPILSYVRSHPFYPKILLETKKHLEEVETEWKKNYELTYPRMQLVTRLKFNKTIEVYITHPDVHQGRYNSVSNTIGWGHHSVWPNYATVYLWHEILHSYFESNQKTHALIELMTDDDLRCFLNHCKYPPFTKEGHDDLIPIKQWIFDKYWGAYLEDSKMDVDKLEQILMNDLSLHK